MVAGRNLTPTLIAVYVAPQQMKTLAKASTMTIREGGLPSFGEVATLHRIVSTQLEAHVSKEH